MYALRGEGRMNRKDMAPETIEDQEIQERETTANQLTDEERFTEPEWLEWFALTPEQRWVESEKLWGHYLEIGGRLDPEPDTQSPFFDPGASGEEPGDGWPGLRAVRRSGV
jgi:hypothetical protein